MATHANLEEFNKEGVLTNLLAIEEHLVGANDIGINLWCTKKHFLLGDGHHAQELQQLLSKKDPYKAKEVSNFRKKWKEVMGSKPTPAEVRDLRNEWREIIGDETLSGKCGTVCALDRRSGSKVESDGEAHAQQTEGGSNAALWIIGGVLVVGIAYLIAKQRARA